MSQRLADRGSRLGAVLLDNVCGLLSLVPGGVALMSAANSLGNDGMGGALFLVVVGFFGFLGVQIYLLVQKGQTIGKRMVGIRIVDYTNGSLLGAGRILGMRGVLPGIIAGIPYVGWLFALVDVLFIFGEDRRCIHDYMARSKVVTGVPGGFRTDDGSTTGDRRMSSESEMTSSLPSTRNVGSAGEEQMSTSLQRDQSSSQIPSSVDRLREVLQNLEELRDDGTLTEQKYHRSKRKALVDLVEQADAHDDALLRGLRQLRDEGHLKDADVQTMKSIL